ncbi:MAG: AAA family ATPase [Tessaracoccus sp.]|uniref:ATP-dependent DNA helicase n=1 Tax=Tessaracoccus sp. TaxID=1971211 RepID=UPI001EB3CFBA|nr:AAA family ATPase [Tessaracoccus sp.]MBK7822986.1 AAA family ATPase [Tessaracoccus sp.]
MKLISNQVAATEFPVVDLTRDQSAVLEQLVEFARGRGPDAVATFSGYAGVGKTTVVGELVRALPDMHVVVAAPTNKAVAVLREKVGECGAEFATVHSLLGLRLRETPDGGQTCVPEGDPLLHTYQLAVVDECSMVSESLFASILSRRGRCRVVFVGDPAQLAPVEARRGELSPTFGSAIRARQALTEVVRQARENPVIRIATMARERIACGQDIGLSDIAAALAPGDEQFLSIMDGGTWRVAEIAADAIGAGLDVRALAHDNRTVLQLNASIHGLLHPGAPTWIPGVPVIAQSEFAMRGSKVGERVRVRNSDLLTVVRTEEDVHEEDAHRPAWRLELELPDRQRGTVFVPVDTLQWQRDVTTLFTEHKAAKVQAMTASGAQAYALQDTVRKASAAGWALRNRYADIRHAYAMTVHKAQGSTFGAVILDWASFQRCPDVGARARLLYVALTRTSKFAVICA